MYCMPDKNQPRPYRETLRAIPRSVWALGVVSLLMDISSEMIHGLLPIYLVTVLGASTIAVGTIAPTCGPLKLASVTQGSARHETAC